MKFVVWAVAGVIGAGAFGGGLSEAEFRNPPIAYGPHVWWHWVNGNVSEKGITADLEAMRRIGIAGAQMFDVNSGVASGDVPFSNNPTSAWMKCVLHAHREAKRLGLELCLANCSGYSSSGGPWIDAARSMKKIVWNEVSVRNARDAVVPPNAADIREGYYEDIAVVAFPTPPVVDLTAGMTNAPTGGLNGGSSWRIYTYDFGEEKSFGDIAYVLHRAYGVYDLEIETSAEGSVWTNVAMIANLRGGYNDEPWIGRRDHHLASEITARHVRLTFRFNDSNGTYYTRFGDRVLLGTLGRMDQLGLKNAALGHAPDEHHAPIRPLTIDSRSIVDVSATRVGDRVSLPAVGDWTVLRLGYTSTGRKCAPATRTGVGLEVDKLDRSAVDYHFDSYIGRVAALCGIDPRSNPRNRAGFNMTLIDSWEVGSQNWTAGFEKTFARHKGYAMTKAYPAIAGYLVDSYEASERLLDDFRSVIGEEFGRNYSDELARKCHAAGILLSIEPYSGQPCSTERFGREVDVPMAEFWWKPTGREDSEYSHSIASIAHTRGRDLVQAESFTSWIEDSSWQQTPYDYKAPCDLSYANGITRTVYHRFAHQPWLNVRPGMTMGYWGTQFERTLTWWDFATDWIKYQTRVQYAMQTGKFAADILFFKGSAIPCGASVPKGLPPGYAFDSIGSDTLRDVTFEKGALSVPGGVRYAVLAFPDAADLSSADRARLDALAAAGAPIVRQGALADWLKANLPKPAFACSDGRWVNWIHRTYGDEEESFFVCSRFWEAKEVEVRLRDRGLFAPELWDAETGAITTPKWSRADGVTTVALPLRPKGSLLVVFRRHGEAPQRPDEVEWEARDVSHDWRLEFPAGWGAPAEPVALATLQDLRTNAVEGIRYFSGTMIYRKTIAVPKGARRVVLSLGAVGDLARVKANGVYAPVIAWRPPYEADITAGAAASRDGKVELEVEVVNTWVNRLIGDQLRFGPVGAYSGDDVAVRIPDWVRADEAPQAHGRFTYATQDYWNKRRAQDRRLRPSGLIGPVILTCSGPSVRKGD